MKKPETLGIDAPRVTRDEAVELMIHHLKLAAMYFQATPEDGGSQLEQEIHRMCADDDCARIPAIAFSRAIHSIYESMKQDD